MFHCKNTAVFTVLTYFGSSAGGGRVCLEAATASREGAWRLGGRGGERTLKRAAGGGCHVKNPKKNRGVKKGIKNLEVFLL